MTAAAATGDAIAALSIKHPGLTDAEVADDVACVLAAAAPSLVAAERERIAQLAERVGAEYPDGDDGEVCCDAGGHKIWKSFAGLLRDPPGGNPVTTERPAS